ncbi:MAG: 2-oxoglutarate and iron-dependent oxygenase domain-containing protein, partial [Bdellovibrionales bacterium]
MDRIRELSLKSYTEGTRSEQVEFMSELMDGLQEHGFIILRDHPIKVELLHQAYALGARLFQLPEQTKLQYAHVEGGQRGYTPFGREHAKNSKHPDLKEFWHVGRDLPPTHRLKAFFPNNIWPSEIPEFEPVFRSLFRALDDTGRILLRALTQPLAVEHDFFTRMTDMGSSILRLLHYPPIPEHVDPGCVRAAAHE